MAGIQKSFEATKKKSVAKTQKIKNTTNTTTMSWKYSQAGNTRAAQNALANALRATARAGKISARRGTGGGFGNLNMAAFAGRQPAARYGYGARAAYPIVNTIMTGERKYFDTFFNATVDTAADWATSNVPMTSYMNADGSTVSAYTDSALIPSSVGTGYGQMQGNKYLLKSLTIRGELIPGAVQDAVDMYPAGTVRLCLVMDTQPNGAQATGNLIFTDWGTAAQSTFSYMSISAGSGGRFKILADKIIQLQPATAGTDGASTNSLQFQARQFNLFKSWPKGLKVLVKSGGSTPAIAQLGDVNIFMIAHNSNSGPPVTIRGNARCSFLA